MHIKSILTPLLLLSFATGLYNPIKASEADRDNHKASAKKDMSVPQNSKHPAVRIHVFFKDDPHAQQAHTFEIGNTLSITVATNNQDTSSAEDSSSIIDNLLHQLNQASPSNEDGDDKQVEVGILIELPKDYIEKAEDLADLDDWLTMFTDSRLAAYTKLLITGWPEDGQQQTPIKKQLAELVNGKPLFFTKIEENDDRDARTTLDDNKIIYAGSHQAALAQKEDLPDTTDIKSIKEALNPKKEAQDNRENKESLKKMLPDIRSKADLHIVLDFFGMDYQFTENKGFVRIDLTKNPDINSLKLALARATSPETDYKKTTCISLIVTVTYLKQAYDRALLDWQQLTYWLSIFGNASLSSFLPELVVIGDHNNYASQINSNLRTVTSAYTKFSNQQIVYHNSWKAYFTSNNSRPKAASSSGSSYATATLKELMETLEIVTQLEQAPLLFLFSIMAVIVILCVLGWDSWRDNILALFRGGKTSEDSAKVNNSAQPQVPDTPSTSVPASNSGNRPAWGFQAWLLLIMAMILIVGGGYWYMRREKED